MASVIRGSDNFDSLIHQGLGVNQTWQDVTASRTKNVTYTNTTGKPIQVSISVGNEGLSGNPTIYLYVDSVIVASWSTDSGSYEGGNFWQVVIPKGSSYYVTGTPYLSSWLELR